MERRQKEMRVGGMVYLKFDNLGPCEHRNCSQDGVLSGGSVNQPVGTPFFTSVFN